MNFIILYHIEKKVDLLDSLKNNQLGSLKNNLKYKNVNKYLNHIIIVRMNKMFMMK